MTRLLPIVTGVFVAMVATLVSSCARDCVAPEALYAQRPPAGVDYGPGPGAQPYGQPAYPSVPPPGSYPSGPPAGSYPYAPPPSPYPYGPHPGTS